MKKYKEKSLLIIEHVNNEIGVDVSKYQNNEILGKISDIIMIQNYSIKSIYKPLTVCFLLYVTGFFIFSFGKIGIFVYSIFGLLLCLINGTVFGVIGLLSNLKNDLKLILNSAVELTRNICLDFNQLGTNLQTCKNPTGLVLEGVVAAVIIPTLSNKFEKVPFSGVILMSGSDKVLSLAINEYKKREDKTGIQKFVGNNSEKMLSLAEKMDAYIRDYSNKTDKIINQSFGTILLPLKIIFALTIFSTFLFLLGFIIF